MEQLDDTATHFRIGTVLSDEVQSGLGAGIECKGFAARIGAGREDWGGDRWRLS
jgi:hypothetical protein